MESFPNKTWRTKVAGEETLMRTSSQHPNQKAYSSLCSQDGRIPKMAPRTDAVGYCSYVPFCMSSVHNVHCTGIYLHNWTLQSSADIGHQFPNKDDNHQRLSSHTQHSGQDSETSGISVDCCRIEQVTQTAKREEAKARLQSWTTG